jgi:transposase-like protein
MKADQDLLLYPLATAEMPTCPACGSPMAIVLHEARENRPDFSTFRCDDCARSEKFVCEE